jgi:hypothetical protein
MTISYMTATKYARKILHNSMGKSFSEMLSLVEAPMPMPPPPMKGGLGGPPMGGLGGPSIGGGLPPMPPPPMGGGLGGGLGGLGGPSPGGGDPSQQPIPVTKVDAMDVWKILGDAIEKMDQHEELNVAYKSKKQTQAPPPEKKHKSLT